MATRPWKLLAFDDAVLISPSVPLARGKSYPFVDMQAIDPASPTVGPSEQRNYTGGGSRFACGDTLMARITPCLENGKIARYRTNCDEPLAHGSTEFIVIRGRDGVTDNDFVYYLTRWDGVRGYAISQMTGSSGRQRVPAAALSHLSVSVPPLDEQRAIAHVLGTLDDKIELNRRMNETLEAIARTIFKSWFVEFAPVRAKADDRDPGLPKPLANLFPDSLIYSPIGPVPKGWRCVSLPDVIDVNPSRPLRKGETAPYLDMANMPTRGHMPDAWTDRAFGSGMRFMNGDTLVARITPCLENGKTAFVTFLNDGQIGWGSTEFIVLRSKPPLPLVFAYCLSRTDEFRQFAIQKMTGSSGRQRVPADSLSRFFLAEPPEPVAQAFGKIVAPFVAQVTANVNESRSLAAIRDTLLPKLMSSEIRASVARCQS